MGVRIKVYQTNKDSNISTAPLGNLLVFYPIKANALFLKASARLILINSNLHVHVARSF